MILASLHILGTVFVLFFIFIATTILFEISFRRKINEVFEHAANELDLKPEEVSDEKHKSKVAVYLIKRYSSDRFSNRLSDMIGIILYAVEIISFITQLALVVFITWLTFSDSVDAAKTAWLIVPVSLAFLIFHQLLYWISYLSTGRIAGEAKAVRKYALGLAGKN
ncbi:hypothetical protein [Halomonas sp.]|uniref:hypothetical protein n=1 Tax=Halomonas sp. TaxID=1486246 RepID=UPI003A8FA1C7